MLDLGIRPQPTSNLLSEGKTNEQVIGISKGLNKIAKVRMVPHENKGTVRKITNKGYEAMTPKK